MEWNRLDKIIANIRYRKIDRYVPEFGVLCDIGCGRNADFLKRHAKKIKKGYGFDFRIQDSIIDNIEIYNNKGMNHFPIADNICDTVFMIALLEHLDDPLTMLEEIHRILNDNGTLVLTTPTRLAKPILEFMAFKLHIINEEEILEHKHYYSKIEILDLFKQTGFSDVYYKKFCFGVNSFAVARVNKCVKKSL